MPDAPPLPPEIRVEIIFPDGVRYVFPKRDLGVVRYIGCATVVMGLLFSGFALFWIVGAAGLLDNAGGGVFRWVFALFGVPFVIGGLWPVRFGLLMAAGHSEIELQEGTLTSIDRAGPVRMRRKIPIENIARFEFPRLARQQMQRQRPESGPAALAQLTGTSTLQAVSKEGSSKGIALAPGYPLPWLQALAHDLSNRCEAELATGVLAADPDAAPDIAVLPVVESDIDDPVEVRDQPSSSKIKLEEFPDGLTFNVPPAGLAGAGCFLFGFSIAWITILTMITAGFVIGGVDKDDKLWVAYLVIGLFWAIGIGLLLAAWHTARSRAVVAVVGDRLMVLKSGPLRKKSAEWPRDQIQAIDVLPSGMEVNDQPVLQLQILPRGGSKFGLLGGRDVEELRWMATRLRKALGIRGSGDVVERELDDPRLLDQPADSRIRVEQAGDGVTLHVPPAGFRKGALSIFIIGLLFGAGAAAGMVGMIVSGADAPWPAFIAIGVFMLVGLGLMIGAVSGAMRSAVLAVVGGRLLVLQKGLFGSKTQEWEPGEIQTIRLGPSGWVINGRPIQELQVIPLNGSKFGLFRERDDHELLWIAATLRKELGVAGNPISF